ncbi:YebC/PmpR family DNA-binding transcriptional regulator [Neorickettsia findlayensis]|uniref:Probable transcriptional regulatory protein GP480_02585 n=1 Tax=Neorickettsia findlayensis TaxID=2686014 RepID=A0A6P1GBY1_9RICK|nr:YebC/PmpR family DNA-binding transcriptional regulator [Neorickettsia findlayensis]QHD65321.1 YebC/PmpR family DNA-binding transcriptional regulator [Neorickettsia findlayensis]
MAGHSQYANIKHRKNAQDAKRARKFTKLRREILVAARSGLPDPEFNPRLRSALANARRCGLPKDKIESAIRSSADKTEGDYQEVCYMAAGSGAVWPSGFAVVVTALTDNKNRTASNIKHIFSKSGLVLADVSFMFENFGVFSYPKSTDLDTLMEVALEAGALDVKTGKNCFDIYCSKENFAATSAELRKKLGEYEHSGLVWIAKTHQEASQEVHARLEKLVDTLEEDDDVQRVYTSILTEQESEK